jgi:hypothetical protein
MRLTKPQQKSLHYKWIYWNDGKSYLRFRRSVQNIIGGDGAVCVQWNGMWLAIEPDGYTHS